MIVFNRQETKEKRRHLRKEQTDAERRLWDQLRNKHMNGYKFFRQYGIGSYIADFYCPALKVVVEVDGGQHYSEDGKIYDDQRDKFFRTLGIRTIRFNNLDVLRNLEGVVENLQKELPLTPSFSKRGEVKRSINVF
ncbi:MAG TPA: endonuclease domain-containing protein [Candidatus Omnitrophota bacterium]|nr:endonuclease domain-containing protein [Candidatus Omnitrophota bacterium]